MELQRDKIVNVLRERAYEIEEQIEEKIGSFERDPRLEIVEELRSIAAKIRLGELA
jgi:hypothetical protein